MSGTLPSLINYTPLSAIPITADTKERERAVYRLFLFGIYQKSASGMKLSEFSFAYNKKRLFYKAKKLK